LAAAESRCTEACFIVRNRNAQFELAMRSIDPLFRYTLSRETDIRKSFARVRGETRAPARSSARSDIFDRTISPMQRKRAAQS
jgi:hypothetical protein